MRHGDDEQRRRRVAEPRAQARDGRRQAHLRCAPSGRGAGGGAQPGGTPVFCLHTSSFVVAGSLWSQLPPLSSSEAKIPGVAAPGSFC